MVLQPGSRVPTVSEYTEESRFSRGTIQNALQFLKDKQAIVLESKGHLGSYILEINYQILWACTELGTLTGAMPLPYSKLYEGLATGIYAAAERYGGQHEYCLCQRGKHALIYCCEDFDYVITSEFAAQAAKKEGLPIKKCLTFGRGTYLSEHVILFAEAGKTAIESGMKVGVDQTSIDMQYLTQQLCAQQQVEFVHMPYNQIVNQIKQKN